ncbi:MAG: hypothetical protein UHW60_08445 [Methanobrevibacter sp.]|nr:hypothetical protein [Methanobrevibacter sp.]
MEIRINDSGSKDYYGEVLAVMSNYGKLVKNPRQKIRGLHKQAMMLTGIALVFLVVFSILYAMDMSYTLYFYIVIIFAVALVLGIIYNILINRRISQLKNPGADKRLVIENDHVEMSIDGEKTRLLMSEIQYILINNYSIAFLPQNISSKMIAVGVAHKNEILNSINEKNIIIDNSDLY